MPVITHGVYEQGWLESEMHESHDSHKFWGHLFLVFLCPVPLQFDTNPQGTIKLVLSDDFANSSMQAKDLSYCQGKTPCQFLDPWDLNWPSGNDIISYRHHRGTAFFFSESRAVTIATLAKDRIQERVPVDGGGGRVEFMTSKENVYFTQGPESVVIKV